MPNGGVRITGTVASGLGFVAAGAVILWLSSSFPPAASVAADPALLPRAVGILLVACGAGVIATSALRTAVPAITAQLAGVPGSVGQVNDEGEPNLLGVLPVMAGTMVYAWLALNVGYLTMTAVFLLAATLYLGGWHGRARLLRLVVFAVVFAVAVQYLFSTLLNVPMPRTFLP